jgi:hypothetical protein
MVTVSMCDMGHLLEALEFVPAPITSAVVFSFLAAFLAPADQQD